MKQYNGEKAIISLTSWAGRMEILPVSLYTLITAAPGYHIVLVLSSDEFKNKEDDLPAGIRYMINKDLIEVLWVKRNYKTLKKVLFTMQKYKNVPVISADDDHDYKLGFADKLYDTYKKYSASIVTMDVKDFRNGNYTAGWATLYAPNCFGLNEIDKITASLNEPKNRIYYDDDDAFMEVLRCNHRIVPVHVDQEDASSDIIPTENGHYKVYTDAVTHGKIRMQQGIDTNGLIFSYLGL